MGLVLAVGGGGVDWVGVSWWSVVVVSVGLAVRLGMCCRGDLWVGGVFFGAG